MDIDPRDLQAVKQWKKLSQSELCVLCQALFSLATHNESPSWIRETAERFSEETLGFIPERLQSMK